MVSDNNLSSVFNVLPCKDLSHEHESVLLHDAYGQNVLSDTKANAETNGYSNAATNAATNASTNAATNVETDAATNPPTNATTNGIIRDANVDDCI
jgi:hypothetical protein